MESLGYGFPYSKINVYQQEEQPKRIPLTLRTAETVILNYYMVPLKFICMCGHTCTYGEEMLYLVHL